MEVKISLMIAFQNTSWTGFTCWQGSTDTTTGLATKHVSVYNKTVSSCTLRTGNNSTKSLLAIGIG